MKAIPIMLLGVAVAALVVQIRGGETVAAPKPRTVTARELNEGTTVIIGELGVPLITAVEIVAKVEDEMSPYLEKPGGPPIPSGTYLLKIEEINGKKLKEPRALRFSCVHALYVSVAPNEAEFAERLKTLQWVSTNPSDEKAYLPKIRSEADALAYKQRYVGSRHRLVVYEEARQDGEPAPLPPDFWSWGLGWGHQRFETYLCVLAERKL